MRSKLIMKFGGSSLADASCFQRAAEIIRSRINLNPVVVVSAVGASKEHKIKVTDLLREITLSLMNGEDIGSSFETLLNRHNTLTGELGLRADLIADEKRSLEAIFSAVRESAFASREAALDAVMGWGEIFSAAIMTALLNSMGMEFKKCGPRELRFITNDEFQDADILPESLEQIASQVIASRNLLVFPGYIGVTARGEQTTLGRGGSDYTAAILGAALKRDVEIWTDVDGIYRIAPHYLPPQFKAAGHPKTIHELSYEEAFQMAAFGSKVLYEKTLLAVHQAVKKGKHIQLFIKNTFNPEHPGTLVSSKRHHSGEIRGITVLEGTQLFNFYPDSPGEAETILERLGHMDKVSTMLSSRTYGRLSIVLDKYIPVLSALESAFDSHLSKDQVLVKIVGDGLGENSRMLFRIQGALQLAENPEKYGMTIVHKSPQILTDNTFEFLVKKRGLAEVLLALYKNLFMQQTVTVGMMGLGTVGKGVLHYADTMYSPEKGGFNFSFPVALVRDPARKRDIEFSGKLTTNPDDILDDPLIDVVLEVMGGIEPARTLILKALEKGKHVVTANKALLAEKGIEIFEAASRFGRNLGFEASVCGEIPIIDDFLKFPGLQDIQGIEGIVNGTSNYVLSRFMEGRSLEEAVAQAQEKGFAEADPTLDLSGADATQKLSILSSILFNQPVDYRKIPRYGLDGLRDVDRAAAEKWGFLIKPLAIARIDEAGLTLRVSPAFIPGGHPLALVRDENNALVLYLKGRKEPITKIGKGAGAIPTARSVVKDIMEVSRKARAYMVDLPGFFRAQNVREIACAGEFEARWYVRFTVTDYPGVLGKVASILGDFELSIRRVFQEEIPGESSAHVILELKRAPWSRLETAIDVVGRLPFVKESFTSMIEQEEPV